MNFIIITLTDDLGQDVLVRIDSIVAVYDQGRTRTVHTAGSHVFDVVESTSTILAIFQEVIDTLDGKVL